MTIVEFSTKVQEIQTKIKPIFLQLLEEHCTMYKILSISCESPAWYQYQGIEDNYITIMSSQIHLGFMINLNECLTSSEIKFLIDNKHRLTKIFYDYFRTVKYDYLHEFQPTIETPLQSKN